MKHFASPDFWFHYRLLPEPIQNLADKNFAFLKENPNHPSLRLKKVGFYWSVRVGGIDFENSSIHPGYSSSSADGHRGLYQKLSESKRVLAYYNPSDHSESYLITGNFGFHKAAFFGGLLFFSAGIFFMLTFHYAFTGSSNYADKLTVIQQVEQAE